MGKDKKKDKKVVKKEEKEEVKDSVDKEEEKKEEKKVEEKSDVKKRAYAILCLVLGTFEYVIALCVIGILFLTLGRVIAVGLHFPYVELFGYFTAFFTYVLGALWIRRRYTKGVTKVVGKTCWNIVLPCTLLVILMDLFVVFLLKWMDKSMDLGLDPSSSENVTENVTVIKPFDMAVKCVLAPICEEFVFRFALVVELQKLAGTSAEISPRIQGALSGVAFGLLHVGAAFSAGESPIIVLSHVCFAASFGVAMTFLDGAAGNRLWPSIICHMCNNILVTLVPMNTAVTEWRSIGIIAGLVLIQSIGLVCMSFVPVPKPTATLEKKNA